MTSDARARPQEEDAVTATRPAETPSTGRHGRPSRRRRPADDDAAGGDGRDGAARRARRTRGDGGDGDAPRAAPASLPLVPVLAVLLVLLLAGVGFLWFTRPEHVGGPHRRLRGRPAGRPLRASWT